MLYHYGRECVSHVQWSCSYLSCFLYQLKWFPLGDLLQVTLCFMAVKWDAGSDAIRICCLMTLPDTNSIQFGNWHLQLLVLTIVVFKIGNTIQYRVYSKIRNAILAHKPESISIFSLESYFSEQNVRHSKCFSTLNKGSSRIFIFPLINHKSISDK